MLTSLGNTSQATSQFHSNSTKILPPTERALSSLFVLHKLQPYLEICQTKHSRCLFYSRYTRRTSRCLGKCVLNKELLASVTLNINTAPKCGYTGQSINTQFFLLLFFLGGSGPVVHSKICLSFISGFILFVIYALLKKWTRKAWKVRTVQAESIKTLEKI